MPGLIRSLFGLLLTFVVLSACAKSTMHVAAIHYPAWLVRNHQTLSLEPGAALPDGDLIRTGDGSRVQLALSGGRDISPGESARFLIEGLPAVEVNPGFTAAESMPMNQALSCLQTPQPATATGGCDRFAAASAVDCRNRVEK